MKKPILVTGGAGFIGANLVDRLASEGNHVIVYDSLKRRGSDANLKWLLSRHHNRILVKMCDIRSESHLQECMQNASAVFHLAAQTAVTTSLDDPVDDFAVNANGTLMVLEAVRHNNRSIPVIMASTNKVYGHVQGADRVEMMGKRYRPVLPGYTSGVPETQPLQLVSPYGISKGAADQYVLDYAHSYGMRTAVMRMSCVYGEHQNGTEDQGWVAHFLIRAILNRSITIFGDGFQVRDLLHIDDAVEAWVQALARIDEIKGQAFNLGGGPENAASLVEVLECIGELCGRKPEIEYGDWRVGDQRWYVSDIRKVSQALDWSPRISVKDGLSKLHAWLRQELEARA